MRTALALVVGAVACARAATPTCPPVATADLPPLWSEPEEYVDRPISREAGADYFLRTGVGDPYGAGMALPVFLGLASAYPKLLGGDFRGFDRIVGTFPESDAAGPATPPLGLHLTRDPNSGVSFVVANCQLCHAAKLRLPGGDRIVSGLGNPRIRIHAWDAALARIARDETLTIDRLLALADAAAKRYALVWPSDTGRAVVDNTLRLMRERDRARGDDALALERAPTGRVATIESFMMAMNHQAGTKLARPSKPGWAKVPDVIGFRVRDTLSWDGVGVGSPNALAAEADFAFGVRPIWYDRHRHIGTSLFLYLRSFERTLAFPGKIDGALATRGRVAFEATCARCHGTYSLVEGARRTTYREQVIPLGEIGTDPARANAVTQAFVDATNAMPITRGLTLTSSTHGYVPPVLHDVWARAPYGHAGQWPDLHVLATAPAKRPKRVVLELDAPYDLDAVGIPFRESPDAPEIDPAGHAYLAELPPDERAAVLEYLKTL